MPYFRAASTKARLRGRVMGLFGGRSLGIDTGTFDPMQWRSQFGVDVDHIDQLEIVRRADLIDADRVDSHDGLDVRREFASIAFDDEQTDRGANWQFQVRCYLANKDINAGERVSTSFRQMHDGTVRSLCAAVHVRGVDARTPTTVRARSNRARCPVRQTAMAP